MKSKGFFLLLLMFASLSFVWWSVQIYRSDLENNEAQKYVIKVEIALAKQEVRNIWLSAKEDGKKGLEWLDSAKRLIHDKHPNLRMKVNDSGVEVMASDEIQFSLEHDLAAKRRRRIFEGSIFFSVLLISFIWIYRSLVAAIDLNRQQNNFLLAVTHELKTPVAGIKLLLETLKRGLGIADQTEIIKQGIKESDRLNELVENILIATRLQDDKESEGQTEVDIAALAGTCIERMKTIYANYDWQLFVPYEALVVGDEIAIRLVFMNLLDNARKYSQENTKIIFRIEPKAKKKKYLISIIDEGKGIPERDKKKVFTKFYRVDEEIRRRSKGTGLGLFIVKEVLAMHKAEVWIEDNDPQGSKFCILIPQI